MTRECDDSRHFADQQQQPSLSWDRVHAEEQYQRTSHNFGQQRLSAGLSFDVGGARISIGTGGRQGYGGYGYQNDRYYGGDYYGGGNYSQNYNNGYDYSNYGQDYRGYQGNRNNGYRNAYGQSYDNSYNQPYDNAYRNAYGQIVGPQVVTAETSTSREAIRFYYEQMRNEQRYQNTYNDSYQPGYNNSAYRSYDDRYVINGGDQYYGPSNNRFDLNYQYDNGYNNSYISGYDYDRGYNNRNDRYNSPQNWNDGYIIAPSNDYYSNYSDGRYQGNRYNRYDYGQPYDDDQWGYQNRYSQNQYQQYRYPNGRYADQYEDRYNSGRNYGNDYYGNSNYGGNDWMRMRATLQSMLGHSPREFNRNVSDDLGCATIVSAALRQAHGVNIRDTSVNGLENSLRRNGYEAIPVQYAQPGDTIIAHRGGNRHGHAAIYVGDGKVVNNSSAQGRVVVAPLQNFASRDYQSVVAYRRV
ncbi:MAG: hypothetical protein JST89_02015 [Cyanobacteria bacterium SZAS-4]|nr:hypothetical protein [Cyanobacteria bacterium SZAS-4]